MIPEWMKKRTLAAALAASVAVGAEGIKLTPYYDPPGVLTVCRGHTGTDVVKGRKYSVDECNKLMTEDMAKAIAKVDSCVPGLPAHVLAAFGDAVYNMGPTIACDTNKSTAARLLKAGDIAGACNQLPRWDKARVAGVMVALPGLTKRRAEDQHLCLTGEVPA
jgi:lysozyme